MVKKKQTSQQALSPQKYLQERVRKLPIAECFISEHWKEAGDAIVIVSRLHKQNTYTLGFYLVDTFCRGVYDSFYKFNLSEDECKELLETNKDSVASASYTEVHNVLYGAIAFAEEAGIAPDDSFKLTKYILEEDTDDIPLIDFEFGKDGKYYLIANSKLEASRYLPTLKKHLGDDFTYVIAEDDDKEEEYDDYYDEDDQEIDKSELLAQLAMMAEERKAYPLSDYSYSHPAYPMVMNLENQHLATLFYDTEYMSHLPESCITEVLSYPHDSLVRDLELMALFETGCTCDEIPEDRLNGDFYSPMMHILMFLGEVHSENSLDVVLETLRQNMNYYEFHFADAMNEVYIPTLYILGQNQLPKLLSYIKEPGLYTFARYLLFPSVAMIAHKQPERRGEVIEWFRQVLLFYIDHIAENTHCDGSLAGMMMHDLINMKAKELLPEIKALYDTGKVDLQCCGNYKSVEEKILTVWNNGLREDYSLDIYERYQLFAKNWK